MRPAFVLILAATLLTGCTAAPQPEPTTPPPTTPAPSTPPAALPALDDVMRLLDTSGDDGRAPQARLGVALEPDQPQTLTDAREQTTGPGIVRVGCSSVGGVPVTIRVDIGGTDQGSFEAQCGEAPGATFVTQEASYDFAAEYTFTVESSAPAVVAIGVVTD